ncbi:MAG TPA: DEAD/DEAH box helicase, partial [Burkholderiaceae bacterium]
NRLEELISIVQFVDRHRLGPTWRLLHEHQRRDETGRVTGYQGLDRIGKTLAPVMLRRRKAEVLSQLPARVDSTRFVPMTEQQLVHHNENGEIVRRIVSRWRKTGYISEADQRRLTCALQNMRMSCNSTYLLDHETDHGAKSAELVDLLEEMLAVPGNKVVVFSQWVRTHEILIRRLEEKGWGHVLFHGGVPSEKRPPLVDRFLQDPDCRVFLSTDAGGVGLNLQHGAATVINMDLPWNPAVLEQRIGRVFRLGQPCGVQVVNLVAQGTIEEGMLSLLSFKKSLFAGVLDGGESEVFMHGGRLSKFMESVEQVTGAAGVAGATGTAETLPTEEQAEPRPNQPLSDAETPSPESIEPAQAPPRQNVAGADSPPPLADAWAPLVEAGLAFVNAMASSGNGVGTATKKGLSRLIETDADTGKPYIKLPMPEPAALGRLAEALAGLLSSLPR